MPAVSICQHSQTTAEKCLPGDIVLQTKMHQMAWNTNDWGSTLVLNTQAMQGISEMQLGAQDDSREHVVFLFFLMEALQKRSCYGVMVCILAGPTATPSTLQGCSTGLLNTLPLEALPPMRHSVSCF